ncbi:uncharacterized protein LOC117173746 [Belonocnema kinseyi]|uniref:uncharacterized protein LOC117173746 n=1 Tax=Belonocnema kinseyi TaxID=2817044 RepID=UPI00143D4C91|nr:uncharacterized protein LOC117173746 [Belonocnema kinseyi]
MGELPKNRIVFERAFLHTGIDYCGPFSIKERKYQNRNKIKIYAAIFVCFATKAVHIEIVSDLTTEAFLACLKRFFARRGKGSNLYSDNATNFKGAQRELAEILNFLQENNDKIYRVLADDEINWHFIPPRSPHFGGLWEAAVKSFKRHLVRVIGEKLLTYEQFTTVATEIEGILNSRPLAPISSDPNDLSTLTSGHFLIGDSITSVPEQNLLDLSPGRLSSWQQVQQIKQHFWARWHKEYLHELTVRKKWHKGSTTDIQIGTILTIRDDNQPPMRWKLGRVIKTTPDLSSQFDLFPNDDLKLNDHPVGSSHASERNNSTERSLSTVEPSVRVRSRSPPRESHHSPRILPRTRSQQKDSPQNTQSAAIAFQRIKKLRNHVKSKASGTPITGRQKGIFSPTASGKLSVQRTISFKATKDNLSKPKEKQLKD